MFGRYLVRITTFDRRSLAFFRIMLGFMVLADLIARARLFELMYSERGLTNLDHIREVYGRAILNSRHFSLHMIHGSDLFQVALFLVAGICGLCLILGWHTRLFTVACWILHLSVQTRNPIYGSAADTTLGLMLFWGMFLPLATVWSLDRRRGRRVDRAVPIMRLGGACYLIQICLIYVAAAWAKGPSWYDGTAFMNIMEWELTVTQFGLWLTNFPWVLSAATHLVLFLELFGTALLLSPFRLPWARAICVILFMGLHVSIALTLDIGIFPYFSLVLWMPFIPGTFWQWLGQRLGRPVLLLESSPAGENEAPVDVRTEAMAEKRSTGPGRWFKELGPAPAIGFLIGAFTMGCILLTTAPVLRIASEKVRPVRKLTNSWLSLTKLRQSWSVFATEKNLIRDGWFMIVGTLEDGREVDLLRNSAPPDWRKPSFEPGGKKRLSIVWTTYLSNQERGEGPNLDRLASYLNWKHKQRFPEQSASCRHIRMIFMEEPAGVQGDEVEATEVEFWAGPPP